MNSKNIRFTFKNIEDAIKELKILCELNRRPVFISCIEHDEFINDAVCTGSRNIVLYDDMISACLLLLNGFQAVKKDRYTGLGEMTPKRNVDTMNFTFISDNEIQPILDASEELVNMCNAMGIPILICICIENSSTHTLYKWYFGDSKVKGEHPFCQFKKLSSGNYYVLPAEYAKNIFLESEQYIELCLNEAFDEALLDSD